MLNDVINPNKEEHQVKITTEEIPITSWLTKIDRIESKLQFGIILSGTQDASLGSVKVKLLKCFYELCSKLTSNAKKKLLTAKQASLFNEYRIAANVCIVLFYNNF